MDKKCYIGAAGWSYKDWEGIVYPSTKKKNFSQLKYISKFFNTVEINSSFYRPPAPHTTKNWVKLVAENLNFSFSCKLWQKYTHDRKTLPTLNDEKMVKSGLDPLLESGKLGALLVQFPWSFKNEKENREWLDKIIELFKNYRPVIEVRHLSWNNPEVFEYLKNKKVGFANIDQPVIGKSLTLSAKATSNIAYLRLHGRNYKNWFKDSANAVSRYDYLYNESELSDISDIISNLIENNPKTYIIFNNHYRGQAIANALQTLFFIEKRKVSVPPTMVDAFPALKKIALEEEHQGQLSIF